MKWHNLNPSKTVLKSLYLRNFRNYRETEIHFSSTVNLFCGANAQGKTNLLEAIYLLSTGRSFRTTHLSELIHYGEPFFYLEALVEREGLSQSLKLFFDGAQRKFQCDLQSHSSFTPLLGLLPSVLHTPYDMNLIAGSPTIRRRFCNLHIAQYDPLYVYHLMRFSKAMRQRNELLKSKQMGTIECWEEEMAQSAVYIWIKREEMLSHLQKTLPTFTEHFSQTENPSIRYLPSLASFSKDSYLKCLEKNRSKEILRKETLIGPHRDDFCIYLQDKPAKTYASEGQKRSFIAALRFSEWQRLSQLIDSPALMSIDDVTTHFDNHRQNTLKKYMNDLTQVFLTSPIPQEKWTEEMQLFSIKEGKISFT